MDPHGLRDEALSGLQSHDCIEAPQRDRDGLNSNVSQLTKDQAAASSVFFIQF